MAVADLKHRKHDGSGHHERAEPKRQRLCVTRIGEREGGTDRAQARGDDRRPGASGMRKADAAHDAGCQRRQHGPSAQGRDQGRQTAIVRSPHQCRRGQGRKQAQPDAA
jgi:hypothetical protein